MINSYSMNSYSLEYQSDYRIIYSTECFLIFIYYQYSVTFQ